MRVFLVMCLAVMLTGYAKGEIVHHPQNEKRAGSPPMLCAALPRSTESFQQGGNAGDGQADEEAKSDEELMQGTWLSVSHGTALIFEGDNLTFKETLQGKSTIAYKLDPTDKPKHIDLILEKNGNTLVNKGIYSLRGNVLSMYFGKQPNHRPTQFSTKKAGGQEVRLLVSCRAGKEESMAEIQKHGGEVTVDKCSPDGTIRAIIFTGRIGRARLTLLKGLTELQTLQLLQTSVTDAVLVSLSGLTKLETLDIGDFDFTDAGLDHVKGLKKLRALNLHNTDVTDEGVKKLQQALPKCKIRY